MGEGDQALWEKAVAPPASSCPSSTSTYVQQAARLIVMHLSICTPTPPPGTTWGNSGALIWRAVCTKNNVDVVKLILGRVARGRGLVGVTYVGVAYTTWIVVVLLCSCLLVTGHPSVSVRVTVSKSLCLCH